MPADFDPYHEWLGIAPRDQPPHLYRLLGVDVFEPNLTVIENAAEQRMTYLRNRQMGKHGELTQPLLNELASGRIVLLTPEKKAAYDEELRRAIGDAEPSVAPRESIALVELPSQRPQDAPLAALSTARRMAPAGTPLWQNPLVLGIGGLGLLFGIGLIIWTTQPPAASPPVLKPVANAAADRRPNQTARPPEPPVPIAQSQVPLSSPPQPQHDDSALSAPTLPSPESGGPKVDVQLPEDSSAIDPTVPEVIVFPPQSPGGAAINPAVAPGEITTEILGQRGYGMSYRHREADGAVLVGFVVSFGKFGKTFNYTAVGSLQPIYMSAKGRSTGPLMGTRKGPVTEVLARSGFAVAAVGVNENGRFLGLQLTFAAHKAGKLDMAHTYTSNWIGDGRQAETVTAGEGQPIIGVVGTWSKESIRSLGLIPGAKAMTPRGK